MLIKGSAVIAAAALLLGSAAWVTDARAEEGGVKAGFLTCNVQKGWGFIFGSSRDLKCTYSNGSGPGDNYEGQIKRFGVDIGYQAGGVIVWAVFAPSTDVGKGALAGDYGGAAGGASVGVGAGAHVLIGGFQNSFSLQPASIEGQAGLNVAGGIEQVTLKSVP